MADTQDNNQLPEQEEQPDGATGDMEDVGDTRVSDAAHDPEAQMDIGHVTVTDNLPKSNGSCRQLLGSSPRSLVGPDEVALPRLHTCEAARGPITAQ